MTLTREETIERLKQNKAAAEYYAGQSRITAEIENALKDSEAFDMAIEALSSNAISKAYNQGFVEGSVNATVNSNYVCPRCGEKMERKEGGDTE